MEPIVVSAPGKVILHGEHAVVYGKPALATSVDLRCYLLLQPVPSGESVELSLPDFSLNRSWLTAELKEVGSSLSGLRELAGATAEPSTTSMAVLAFLYLLMNIHGERMNELCGLRVTVLSTLPAGAGLGSSAAYSVCLAAGLLALLGSIKNQQDSRTVQDCSEAECKGNTLPSSVLSELERVVGGGVVSWREGHWSRAELEVVNQWGFEAEKLIHGTPSGIDNAISTFGGAMSFRSGEISPLNRMPNLRILLVNTKVPRSTKKMVAGVRERHDKFPEVISPVLSAIEGLVGRAHKHFEELTTSCSEDREKAIHSELQELIRVNQALLNALGVGHAALDQVCSEAQTHRLSVKLTGGGGGGCAIALVPPGFPEGQVESLKSSLTTAGFECWETVVGSNGVTQHCALRHCHSTV